MRTFKNTAYNKSYHFQTLLIAIADIVGFKQTTMKNRNRISIAISSAIILLAMITTFRCEGQSISITQDPSLAFFKDDYGNSPFTTNIRGKIALEGYQRGLGFLTINMVYEYADLKGGNYNRYGGQVGYTFTAWDNRFLNDDETI